MGLPDRDDPGHSDHINREDDPRRQFPSGPKAFSGTVLFRDDSGGTISEWQALIDPERELRAEHMDSLKARGLVTAPKSREIAGGLEDLYLCESPPLTIVLSTFPSYVVNTLESALGFFYLLLSRFGRCHWRPSISAAAVAVSITVMPRSASRPEKGHAALEDACAAGSFLAWHPANDSKFVLYWQEGIDPAARRKWAGMEPRNSRLVALDAQSEMPREHFLTR